MTYTKHWSPGVQTRYYHTIARDGWAVMERVRDNIELRFKRHSLHKTKEEAEAVSLALNALSK